MSELYRTLSVMDAVITGSPATLSLSSQMFFAKSGTLQFQIPTPNIVAVHVTQSEKVNESHCRVHADVLVLEGCLEDDGREEADRQAHPVELKSYEVAYTRDVKHDSSPLLLPRLPDHLLLPPKDGQGSIHVIISTLSGTQKAEGFFERCLKPLLDRLEVPPYDVHRTESPDTISRFTRDIILPRANQGIKQSIILLSGDGGIVDIINTLLGQEKMKGDAAIPVIGVIPMGTGNALFNSSCRPRPHPESPSSTEKADSSDRAWDLHEDKTQGLRTLLFGTPKPLPTFRTAFSPGSTSISYPSASAASSSPMHTPLPTSHPCSSTTTTPPILHGCVLTSWCLHASLISLSDTPRHRAKGRSRFTTAAQTLLQPPDGSPTHVYRGVVSTLHLSPGSGSGAEEWRPVREKDGSVRRKHMYILCTLVSHLEENFTISPDSGVLEGRLRLVSIGDVGVEEVVRVLGEAYQGGRHVREGNKGDGVVGYDAVEGVRIEFDEEEAEGTWRRVCVDGMVVECPRGGWVEVRMDRGREVVDLVTV